MLSVPGSSPGIFKILFRPRLLNDVSFKLATEMINEMQAQARAITEPKINRDVSNAQKQNANYPDRTGITSFGWCDPSTI